MNSMVRFLKLNCLAKVDKEKEFCHHVELGFHPQCDFKKIQSVMALWFETKMANGS